MFNYLYHSVTMNESKEKFEIVLYCFSAIKNIAVPSSSSNFPVKLIFWGIFVFVCLDKNQWLIIILIPMIPMSFDDV